MNFLSDYPILLAVLLVAMTISSSLLVRRLRRLNNELSALRVRSEEADALETLAKTLLEERTMYEELSDIAHEALMLVNETRQVVYLNAVARELFETEGEAANPGDSVMAMSRQHELDDLVVTALETQETISQQIPLRESPYRVACRSVPLGTTTYVVVALEDVSELHRLGRARREMVANVSHELRTPISSIRLLVDTLLRGAVRDEDRAMETLQRITLETDALHQIAQELLDLSMIESGRAEFILRQVVLRDLVSEAITRLSEQTRRGEITVTNDTPSDLVVLADSDHVSRVLNNLLHNAVKFTPPGGTITVEAASESGWATVTVHDTGPGIPASERDRIFERFYRSDRSRGSAGTGLGLAIAKHIVEAHGGRIWADPPPPTNVIGAHIRFTLPVEEDGG